MTQIFADGFESGGTAAWNASNGSPSVVASANLVEAYLLEVNATNKFVQDTFGTVTHYRARFYVKPNAMSFTGTTSTFRMLNVRTSTTAVGRVLLGYNGTNYTVMASVLNDSAAFQNTAAYAITDARHCVEVNYHFGTAGTLQLWIDDVLQESVTGVDCDTRNADNVLLGWTNTGGTVSGTVQLDAFDSNDTDYIGLATSSIVPSGISSAEAFGTPVLTVGSVEILPTGIASAEAFGTPVIEVSGAGEQTISPTGIASAEAFGTATISVSGASEQTILPAGIDSAEAFGTPTISGGNIATDFDDGLHVIPWCWTDDENVWQEFNKLAQSEGGYIYFDKTGKLVYKNREAFAVDNASTVSQYTFAVNRFKDVEIGSSWDDVYNEVIVEYQPRNRAGLSKIYSITNAIELLPGQVYTTTARLDYPAYSITAPVAKTDYKAISPTGDNLNSSLAISMTKYAQTVELELTNNHASSLMIIEKFQLRGSPLVGSKTLQEKMTSTDSSIGDPSGNPKYQKTMRISGNEYIQTREQALALVTEYADRLKTVHSKFRVVDTPIIPWLEVGDRVTLTESDSGLSLDCFIVGISASLIGGVYYGDYTLIEVGAWYKYTDYFTLDVHTIGSSYRVWY